MSIKAARPFRILALPLVRLPHGALRVQPPASAASSAGASSASASASSTSDSSASASPSTTAEAAAAAAVAARETPLILYHVQQPPPPESDGKPPLYQRALDRASDEWIKLGKKKEGSWMRWFFDKGEGLMDRIEFEEWSLKAVHEGQGIKIDKKTGKPVEVTLMRPGGPAAMALGLPPLLPKLHRTLLHRIPHHKKMMRRFIYAVPLTWPFAIIPVIPNFPLFYVLWRAWSHYKAWRGATYLEALLKGGLITEADNEALGKIYTAAADAKAKGKVEKGDGEAADKLPYPGLMLSKADVPALVSEFELGEGEVVDVGRAIEQADHRAKDAVKKLEQANESK
ncbi:hypothetical protein VHUM_00379 [Vanrija humicola]|uniref:Mitochondrial K+-H+ exchange-related-domain-containing protein n=1 Tax=Vanrija humicola TaxID=5417 RepID=A0A7D8V5X4_VANHU|nr:hypothetical protein VHUM_00379 [Vanrija humicola]